jgi:hypothetical protein
MSDEYEIPDHCSLCDNEPTMAVNEVAFCDDHDAVGFGMVMRADAIAKGETDERKLDALERAATDTYTRKFKGNDEAKVGDTVNTALAPYMNPEDAS